MNHGTTASLICPACGQAFLSMQHAMESTTQCPHCAHTALRAHFGTQAQVAGVAQVLRRVAHAPEEPPVAFHPPATPQMWPHEQPAQHFQGGGAIAPQAYAPHQLAAPPSIARHALQPSQALLPRHAPPPTEYPTASTHPHPHSHGHSGGGRGTLLFLVVAAVVGIGLWIWWDHANTSVPAPPSVSAKSEATTPTKSLSEPEVRKAEVVIPPPPPEVRIALQDTQAFAADAKALVNAFFAATTAQERAACVHEGAKHSPDIESLFGLGAPKKIELRQLAILPSVIQSLPGGQHVPLFKLITSESPNGALLKLETGEDGKRLMSWPLLAETHQGALGKFLQQSSPDPAWFFVAMRPSHGLDLPAEVRPKYLTFDVQTSAASEPHFVACVERDTPLARSLDRESDWGKVYLSRLLVRKLEVAGDAPCVVILDCEGAVER